MAEPLRSPALTSIARGLFLASSWTWCIGAFLPLLLLRDFGWSGFLVFALPNVLGAAAVGFLWNRERSERFVRAHPTLLAWFSTATLSFQAFFIAWMAPFVIMAARGRTGEGDALTELITAHEAPLPMVELQRALTPDGSAWWMWLAAMVLFAAVVGSARAMPRAGERAWIWLGVIVTIGSLLLWACEGFRLGEAGLAGSSALADLGWLAPAIALGFLVCPHLDASFHRVVRHDQSRWPWITFVPAFTAMILMTTSAFLLNAPGEPVLLLGGAFVAWWFMQVTFTAAVHARELRALSLRHAGWMVPAALLIGAVAGRPGFGSEATYLRFLGLYGAVFPALALLRWRGYGSAAILGFLAIAIPAFEVGFIGPRGLEGPRWAWAVLIPVLLLLVLVVPPRTMEKNRQGTPRIAE
ncbi:MAG: hypothetical protein KF724_09885 [Phycisphaeraceae bacterium]|nr:hypothetical protein [Phycisphaeraceae bacterium]